MTVPEGWRPVQLGEVYRHRKEAGLEGLPLASVTMNHGLVSRSTLERRTESELGADKHLLVRKGDLVYNTMRMWQGASGVAEWDCLVSPAYVVCESSVEIRPDFGRQTFKSPRMIQRLKSYSQGITLDRLRLYFHHFASIPAVIPPLPEQRKIAAILSSVDDAIAATEAVIEQTRIVKQGLLQDLLTKGIGHTRFKQTPIGEVPEAWEVVRMEEVAASQPHAVAGGPFGSNLTSADYVADGVPVIRGSNLNYAAGTFDDTGFVFVSAEKARDLSRNRAKPGDLVVTQRGTLGQVGLIPLDARYAQYIVSQSQMKMTPEPHLVAARFVWHYLLSPIGQTWIERSTIATGIPHINLGTFKRMPIPLPPLKEQAEIVRLLGGLQAGIEASAARLDRLKSIKSGLLQDLLTGAVRVTP